MFTAASFQSWGCFGAPCWAFFHGLCHRGCSCVLEGVSHFQREQDSSASGTCSSQLSSGATFSQRPSHLTHSWRNCTIAQCRTCRAVEASGGESHETITAGTAVILCFRKHLPGAWPDTGRGFIAAAPVGLQLFPSCFYMVPLL